MADLEQKAIEITGPFAYLVEFSRKLTPAQSRAILISAGILTAEGELAPHYQPKPTSRKKPAGSRKTPAKKAAV